MIYLSMLLLHLNMFIFVHSQSLCFSINECCSHPARDTSDIVCCGSNLTGEAKLSCNNDGYCYRGETKCWSSYDHPSCNYPSDNSIDKNNWDMCRQKYPNDVIDSSQYGGKAIHVAVAQGLPNVVLQLLEEGHSINEVGNGGATPLHIAGMSPQGERLVHLLIAHGANMNVLDDMGYTPLHRSCHNGLVQGTTSLLFHGADVNIRGAKNETPLHLAAYENCREIAQVLLSYGADPYARNVNRYQPFDLGLFDLAFPPSHML